MNISVQRMGEEPLRGRSNNTSSIMVLVKEVQALSEEFT